MRYEILTRSNSCMTLWKWELLSMEILHVPLQSTKDKILSTSYVEMEEVYVMLGMVSRLYEELNSSKSTNTLKFSRAWISPKRET